MSDFVLPAASPSDAPPSTAPSAPPVLVVDRFLKDKGVILVREGNRLSSADLDRMLWPLLESLERVHTRGFFHGDINPANIVLDAVGKPTLIDFGAARMFAEA